MPVYQSFSKKKTPQSVPIPGRTEQIRNEAGGYVFAANKWTRLNKFLILGSDTGYYIDGPELTRQNAECVLECLAENGQEVIRRVVDVSKRGLSADNDPAIFALALAMAEGDMDTKRAAEAAVLEVCRIGTHILHFASFADGLRGWGPMLRRAVRTWFMAESPGQLAYQAVKYQSRDGWALADLLRKAHPKTEDPTRNAVFKWIVDGVVEPQSGYESAMYLPGGPLAPIGGKMTIDALAAILKETKEVPDDSGDTDTE